MMSIKKIIITFVSTIFFYRTFINGLSSSLQLVLYTVVPLLYLIFKYGYIKTILQNIRKSYNKILLVSLSLYVVVVIGSLLTILVNGTGDFSYIKRLIGIPINIIGYLFLYVLIDRNLKEKSSLHAFLDMFINVTCLFILFSFFLATFPQFRERWFNVIQISELGAELYQNHMAYAFRIGWNGFAGFGNTFLCTLAIVFSLIKITNSPMNNNILAWLRIGILLLGNAFYGRIGLFVSGIVILIFVIQELSKLHNFKNTIYFFLIAMIIINFVTLLSVQSNEIVVWINWILDPFISILNEGTFGQNTMFAMYFLPDISTIIFGDGQYNLPSGGYYMSVDVGYMRPLLYFGFFFTALNYLTVILQSINLKKYLESKYFYYIVLIVFIYEIKGEVIFNIIPFLFAINLMLNFEQGDKDE